MDLLDLFNKWCNENDLVVIGLFLVVAAFILSFSCKTAWGAWKNRK